MVSLEVIGGFQEHQSIGEHNPEILVRYPQTSQSRIDHADIPTSELFDDYEVMPLPMGDHGGGESAQAVIGNLVPVYLAGAHRQPVFGIEKA